MPWRGVRRDVGAQGTRRPPSAIPRPPAPGSRLALSARSSTPAANGRRRRRQQGRVRAHAFPHVFEKVERAEGIPRPLNEQDRRPQFEEDLVAQLRPIAGAAERIAEADHGCDRLREGDVAADAPAHALAGERNGAVMLLTERRKSRAMRRNQLRQRVRPFPPLDRSRDNRTARQGRASRAGGAKVRMRGCDEGAPAPGARRKAMFLRSAIG